MDFLTDHSAVIGLIVIAGIFVAFTMERYPPAVIAIGGAALFLALGYVTPDDAFAAFSNSAIITIGAMFILSGALVRTGTIEAMAGWITSVADTRPKFAVVMLFLVVLFASAFMNNTPVVLILIPIFIELAGKISASPKRLLIPLSYVSILGGTCTLLGTSTNLLVDGVARSYGQDPIGIFEISLIGLFTAAAGLVYLILTSRILLPTHKAGDSVAKSSNDARILTEIKILAESKYIGQTLTAAKLTAPRGITLVGLRRGAVLTSPSQTTVMELAAGDAIIIRASQTEIMSLVDQDGIELGVATRDITGPDKQIFEISIPPSAESVGQRLSQTTLISRYPIRIIGVSSVTGYPGPDMNMGRVKSGDTLLVESDSVTLEDLRRTSRIVVGERPPTRGYRRRLAPVAIGAHFVIIVLAAMGILPISALAVMGVAVILISRCLDAEEAWSFMDGNVLVLIAAMLIIGQGLQDIGSVDLIIAALQPSLAIAPPVLVLVLVYAMTSIMTEIVTNNAIAVIMTPIVIGLAAQLGIDSKPLIYAVMFGASASFATPVGYQTNTLVYAAGHYKFTDFLKIGVPMNIWVGMASCTAITLFV